MNIKGHPILKQYYDVCLMVESLPASEDQTKASVALADLGEKIESLLEVHAAATCFPRYNWKIYK